MFPGYGSIIKDGCDETFSFSVPRFSHDGDDSECRGKGAGTGNITGG